MSISRGRGWAKNDKDPLPRPGKSLCSEDVDSANFINIINAVDNKNLDEKIKEIEKCISDKEDAKCLENIHCKLYEYAVKNKEFGTKLIMLYRKLVCIADSKENTMQKRLIQSFQSDYERREELRQENATYFRDVICFFSEFLLQYRTTKVLMFALLDYMEMLLETASVDDIKVFTEQVVIHGKYICNIPLRHNFKERLDKLLITARQILIKENVSRASRQMLLYTIDLVNHDFNPLPTDLKKFYKNMMEVTDN